LQWHFASVYSWWFSREGAARWSFDGFCCFSFLLLYSLDLFLTWQCVKHFLRAMHFAVVDWNKLTNAALFSLSLLPPYVFVVGFLQDNLFCYFDQIISTAKPRKLIFLAVDGLSFISLFFFVMTKMLNTNLSHKLRFNQLPTTTRLFPTFCLFNLYFHVGVNVCFQLFILNAKQQFVVFFLLFFLFRRCAESKDKPTKNKKIHISSLTFSSSINQQIKEWRCRWCQINVFWLECNNTRNGVYD